MKRLLREARIGWNQGCLTKAVRKLDRLDPGWQARPRTVRELGLVPAMAHRDVRPPEGTNP